MMGGMTDPAFPEEPFSTPSAIQLSATPLAVVRYEGITLEGLPAAFDEGLRRHMLRVYNYMAIGLVVTGIVAFVVGKADHHVAFFVDLDTLQVGQHTER